MDDLKELATELGTPGFQKLYKAARKRNIDISKTEVKSFLAKQGQKQIFRPLPQSKGKTASEEPLSSSDGFDRFKIFQITR